MTTGILNDVNFVRNLFCVEIYEWALLCEHNKDMAWSHSLLCETLDDRRCDQNLIGFGSVQIFDLPGGKNTHRSLKHSAKILTGGIFTMQNKNIGVESKDSRLFIKESCPIEATSLNISDLYGL